MGNPHLLTTAANQPREDQASRSTPARRQIRRYLVGTRTAEAIAVARQGNRQGIELAL